MDFIESPSQSYKYSTYLYDISLSYNIYGNGNTIILFISGFLNQSNIILIKQLQYFNNINKLHNYMKYKIIILDLPNIGETKLIYKNNQFTNINNYLNYCSSSLIFNRETTTFYAELVIKLIKSLDIKNINLVGISMGGYIAQEISLMIPNYIKSLTLVVTDFGNQTSSPPSLYPTYLIFKALMAKTVDEKCQIGMKLLFSKNILNDPIKYDEFFESYKARRSLAKPIDFKTFFGQYTACQTHHVNYERLFALRNMFPILVVGGADDIYGCESSHLLHDALGGELWLPEAGHGLIFEVHEEFNKKLENFFEKNEPYTDPENRICVLEQSTISCKHRGTCWFYNIKWFIIVKIVEKLIGKYFTFIGTDGSFSSAVLFFLAGSCCLKFIRFSLLKKFSGFLNVPFPSLLFVIYTFLKLVGRL